MLKGLVAIVGRPNVGKSTLFNRLTKSNRAIIDDRPGVTRDRIYGTVECVTNDDDSYIVIDTGGFETSDHYFQPFTENIVWESTKQAIEDSDVVVMTFDGKAGLHPHDRELVRFVQSLEKPVVFLVNKIDGIEQNQLSYEFCELGIDQPVTCSAAHNRGVWELSETIENHLISINSKRENQKDIDPDAIKLALIGRPNAGKSSILNRLCGSDRALVSEVAGTTRDTINANIRYNQKTYEVLDTAGVRRRTKIHDRIENLSVIRSLRSIEDADIVILVITADEGLADQDARLASLAISKHKPVLLVVNKWDLFANKSDKSAREFEKDIKRQIADISYIPVLFTSCLKNQRVSKILEITETLYKLANKRVGTAQVNELLQKAVREHTPALIKMSNKRVKFFYATQVRSAPPTFVIKCNVAEEIHDSYKRYLMKRFRSELGFESVPLRLFFRGKAKENEEKRFTHKSASATS